MVSRFPVKLICCIGVVSASGACSLLKSIASSYFFLNKDNLANFKWKSRKA